MSDTHDKLMNELKIETCITSMLEHFAREGCTLESIGYAFQRNTFLLFVRHAREQYEGITDSCLVKMFTDWSEAVARDYLKEERKL